MIADQEVTTFRDRRDAGNYLARQLIQYANRNNVLVVGLPRGGVVVAYEVARQLAAPLDVFMVRKLGMPGHEELALGAVASGGICVLNHELIRAAGVPPDMIESI